MPKRKHAAPTDLGQMTLFGQPAAAVPRLSRGKSSAALGAPAQGGQRRQVCLSFSAEPAKEQEDETSAGAHDIIPISHPRPRSQPSPQRSPRRARSALAAPDPEAMANELDEIALDVDFALSSLPPEVEDACARLCLPRESRQTRG